MCVFGVSRGILPRARLQGGLSSGLQRAVGADRGFGPQGQLLAGALLHGLVSSRGGAGLHSMQVMASAPTERLPWLGMVYDHLCRKEWAERSNFNEPGFCVDKAGAPGRPSSCNACFVVAGLPRGL